MRREEEGKCVCVCVCVCSIEGEKKEWASEYIRRSAEFMDNFLREFEAEFDSRWGMSFGCDNREWEKVCVYVWCVCMCVFVYVCKCVCVCVWERERVNEREWESEWEREWERDWEREKLKLIDESTTQTDQIWNLNFQDFLYWLNKVYLKLVQSPNIQP